MMVEITYQMVLSTLQTVGILVGIVYYISIMRNQQKTRELSLESQELTRKAQEQTLRTRESQLFMNIYNQSYMNPVFMKAIKVVNQKKQEINSIEDFERARAENPEFADAFSNVIYFFEGLGTFVKEGLIDIRLIALSMAGMTQDMWSIIAPFVHERRERSGYKRWVSEWEYLVNELNRYIKENPTYQTGLEGKSNIKQ